MDATERRSTTLWRYFALSYPVTLLVAAGFLRDVDAPDLVTALFAGAVLVTYTALYMLVPFLLLLVLELVLSPAGLGRLGRPFRAVGTPVVWTLAVLMPAAGLAFLFADGLIHRLYGFHVNGFVTNLVLTPGGIESLGGDAATTRTFALIVAGLVAVQAALLVAARRSRRVRQATARLLPRRIVTVLVIGLVAISAGERITFGIAGARNHLPVVFAADAFPFYLPTSFRGTAERLGIAVEREPTMHLDGEADGLCYPFAPIERQVPRSPNIVWLVSESLRADALNPEIMPETWRFAERSIRFTRHYSSGNGTRMGLFGQFYGLYGNYWFPALAERRGPVLMDLVLDDGYRLGLYTSAKFTYPEFDRTIFARVPGDELHADQVGAGWQRDRGNVGALCSFLRDRDRDRPFMAFLFFESPHARYDFPPESIIREPYLDAFNYATMDLDRDIGLIKARYDNACHHLDQQLGRVFETLRTEGLLDSTIVIVTGDHGEEFMEHGRWGHNSAFTEEQIRVPLVLSVPGERPRTVTRMTSHLDVPATLLPRMGVTNPAADYCLGRDLLGTDPRPFAIVSAWSDLAYVDDQRKAVFPFKARGFADREHVTTRDDEPVENERSFFAERRDRLVGIMQDMGRFGRAH